MDEGGEDILDFEPHALIVFTGELAHWLAPLLHPERRHCFAVIPAPSMTGTSVIVNLTMKGLVLWHADGEPEDLAPGYEAQGLEVVRVPYRPAERQLLPTVLNNCVGLTKQVIGIRSWALTPDQLYRHIRRTQACSEPSLDLSFG